MNWKEICIPPVSGKYGAPMGRSVDQWVGETLCRPFLREGERLYCRRIDLDRGGYDAGGAYWGTRPNSTRLYCLYADGPERVLAYVDAYSRAAAIYAYRAKAIEDGETTA